MLDLAPTFSPEADHLDSLLDRRDERNAGKVPTGVSFIDDCLGGVFPGDLALYGAATGVGKTALAVQTALSGVDKGKEVYLFALEAFVGEVSARLYFEELGKRAEEPALDFAGWWRGQWRGLDKKYGDEVRAALKKRLSRLHTLYKRRGDFTPENLSQQLEAIAAKAEMIVLDHVHVIDAESDRGELRAQRRTVGLLRDIALDLGVPVVAVSHIRKKEKGAAPTLLPDRDDLHGHSDIAKVATQIVLFAREWDGPRPRPYLSPTLMRVAKDRNGRESPYVARMYYDLSTAKYEQYYELGRVEWKERRQQWTALTIDKLPAWAERDARRVLANEEMMF